MKLSIWSRVSGESITDLFNIASIASEYVFIFPVCARVLQGLRSVCMNFIRDFQRLHSHSFISLNGPPQEIFRNTHYIVHFDAHYMVLIADAVAGIAKVIVAVYRKM